jgi:branched-chain amino acid transport system ATP-binding protein
MKKDILSIHNLTAGYGDLDVLFNIDLHFPEDQWVLLIGPNGSGKSTLLKVIGGLIKPKVGLLKFNLPGSKAHKKTKNNVGFLKQTNNIFPALTVEENLQLASFYSKDQEIIRYEEILFSIFPDLKDSYQKRAGLLSGGMRQKLAIGMALARKHDLLLLDEPCAGLAPHSAVEILSQLNHLKEEISKSHTMTIVMVEHNYKYVKDRVSRVIGMREGQIVIDSVSPATILENKKEMEKIFFG